jgi:hypothetical protein
MERAALNDDRAERFREFMKTWKGENVVALYDQRIDPSDRTYLIQQRAKRLKEELREQGLLSLLYDEIGPGYGQSRRRGSDVLDYVKKLFEAADFQKRSGIGRQN